MIEIQPGARVLVTGADGFIGSHLVEALVRHGFSVRALAYYNSFGYRGWLEDLQSKTLGKVEIIAGDIRDAGFVDNAITDVDYVCHLAALIGIPYSYIAPQSYLDTNVSGTLNVLQACKRHSVRRVVCTSTSEVYGTAQYAPIDEKHPLVGQSPYSASKIAADQLAYSFFSSFDLPVVIIRPFNTYGPRQSTRAVIPTIISQAIGDKTEITLGDTSTVRDFNYVDDIVSGFVKSLLARNIEGETINLCTGFEISVGQTVSLIGELLGKEITVISEKKRFRPPQSEVFRLIGQNDKAKCELNWSPKYVGVSGFRDGLQETIAWMQNSVGYDQDKNRGYAI